MPLSFLRELLLTLFRFPLNQLPSAAALDRKPIDLTGRPCTHFPSFFFIPWSRLR